MSRRRSAVKREVTSDPVYGDKLVSQFVNYLMFQGKKNLARKIFYSALEKVSKNAKKEAMEAFYEIVAATKPSIEVKSKRIGSATYQVPQVVKERRAINLSINWIIGAARKRSEKGMENRLAAEFLDVINGRGGAIKKKDDVHKMAESNKAFAHLVN